MIAYLDHQDEELGTVRLCTRCEEEWPKDAEFWYFSADGKVLGHCRACWAERKRMAKDITPGFRLIGKRSYV